VVGEFADLRPEPLEPSERPADLVEVGRIVDAWGIKGWIKVLPHAADPQALFSSRRWYLDGAQPPLLRITQAREQGALVVAAAQELPDRNAAENVKGARVLVSRASFPTPPSDEFYWVDLIGLAVVNRDGVTLGTVVDLIDTGAHSVLRVAPGGDAEERLIPFVASYVDDVDIAARRITVDWGVDY
jgi:16S rRNA processing protein RimM